MYDVVSVATCLNKNEGVKRLKGDAEGLKIQNIKKPCFG